MNRARFVVFAVATAALIATAAPTAMGAGVTVEPGNAKPAQFQPASACGCHTTLVEQWTESMHAQALSDPIYLAKLAEAQKATDGAIGAFCNACHGPAATMTGEIDSEQKSAGVAAGIGCSFCHQVVGLKGEPANTSHLVDANGVRRAHLKDPQAPHPAAYSAFHDTAEMCGGCHNVNHPVNGMHLEATFTEWKQSAYATEGVTCQDCHMSSGPGVIGPSPGTAAPGVPERPDIYAMTFIGAQVELSDSDAATALLKGAATVEIEAPEILPSGSGEVTVTVTNSGAGHYLPTGLTEVREMWLEVIATTADGSKTKVGERRFGTILEDEKGNSPAELWEAVKIKSDDRIPPRESVTEKYAFAMPEGADKVTLTAVLNYRSAPEELAEKAGVENPTTEMAAAEAIVFTSEDARSSQSKDEVSQGTFFDGLTLVIALVGLAAIAGLIVVFSRKSRTGRA